MGSSKSRVTPAPLAPEDLAASTSQGLCSFICDEAGFVVAEAEELRFLFGDSFLGHSVADLMSPALGALHCDVVLPAYAASRGGARARMDAVLSQHGIRSCVVFDAFGEPLEVKLAVAPCGAGRFRGTVRYAARQQTPAFNSRTGLAKRLRLEVLEGSRALVRLGVLVVDLVDSTGFLETHGPENSLERHAQVQALARRLILHRYQPLVSLYEAVGDALLFVAHRAWELPGVASLECLNLTHFAADLLEAAAAVDAKLRVAAAYGEVLAAFLDGQVRLFGSPVTKACRLQSWATFSQGKGRHVGMPVCEAFYQGLCLDAASSPSCHTALNLTARKELVHLKGFAEDVECRILDVATASGLVPRDRPGNPTTGAGEAQPRFFTSAFPQPHRPEESAEIAAWKMPWHRSHSV